MKHKNRKPNFRPIGAKGPNGKPLPFPLARKATSPDIFENGYRIYFRPAAGTPFTEIKQAISVFEPVQQIGLRVNPRESQKHNSKYLKFVIPNMTSEEIFQLLEDEGLVIDVPQHGKQTEK